MISAPINQSYNMRVYRCCLVPRPAPLCMGNRCYQCTVHAVAAQLVICNANSCSLRHLKGLGESTDACVASLIKTDAPVQNATLWKR